MVDATGIKKAANPCVARLSRLAWTNLDFIWWRRGDLNPRPPVLHRRLYMFSFRQLI